ncbi:MAG: uroporphyrinogen decarboxylase family protein [Atribacterota bacterium]|jgi:uroporphyrinogen decarboxylase|uniref:uroporphyrinogen decarboxylase family protein n=1 Tax=Atribacter sp. TaxID=2847780 RepID=UPI00345E5F80|nr:uroporphyrinogen decarboxylase family protein [Atribacterota bacterium]
MDKMTSRERFRKALNHQEPDRVPIDVGQDFHNGIHEVAYRNLLAFLGEEDDIRLYDRIQHLAVCKESILERLHADTRYVFANAPSNWQIKVHADSSWADEWGVVRKNVGLYDESIQCPLAGASIDEIKSYQMPDPVDPARFTGLKERAKELYEGTQYAIIGGSAASLFYLSSELMGFQEYMERLALEPQVIEILVDRILEWEIKFFDKYLEQVGEYVELVWMGDDWGMQSGPIMNPKIFKKLFMPRYKEFTHFVKSKTQAKIALHSCGSILWAMEDLYEAGVDVIHPLQATAFDMGDPEKIKKSFGNKLVFYSNLSNQSIIPHGTPEDVIKEVRDKIKILAPGGGYIISGGHNIQADVPPQNILALFDTAYQEGHYPIHN